MNRPDPLANRCDVRMRRRPRDPVQRLIDAVELGMTAACVGVVLLAGLAVFCDWFTR